MAIRKAKKPTSKSKSWKDIDQDVKAKSMSSLAFRRMLLSRFRKASLFLLIAAGAAVGIRALLVTEDVTEALSKAGRGLPVKHIETESDALSREWILQYLDLNQERMDLLRLDLAVMKERLEAFPQIRSAELVRQIPDTLFIAIEEREPVAKVLAEDVERGRIALLVDSEGVVYEGRGYGSKLVQSLPYLDGIRLKRKEGRFEPIAGMGAVAKLLDEAKMIAPHLYGSWKVVSLAELPNIVVKSPFSKELVFSADPGEIRRQLAELDYIIDYHKGRSVRSVARVDLTLQAQVPVTRTTVAR